MSKQEIFLFLEKLCASLEEGEEYDFEFEVDSLEESHLITDCLQYFCKDESYTCGPARQLNHQEPARFRRVQLIKNSGWRSKNQKDGMRSRLKYCGIQLPQKEF